MDEAKQKPRLCISDDQPPSKKDDSATLQHPVMKPPFRFLDLPAELRNRIYEFAIGGHIVIIRAVDRHDLVRCGRSTADRRKGPTNFEQLVLSVYNLEDSSPTRQDPERAKSVTAETWATYYPQGVSKILNLNFVCRQIRVESALLPYRLNVFCVDAWRWLVVDLEEFTKGQRSAITDIAFLQFNAWYFRASFIDMGTKDLLGFVGKHLRHGYRLPSVRRIYIIMWQYERDGKVSTSQEHLRDLTASEAYDDLGETGEDGGDGVEFVLADPRDSTINLKNEKTIRIIPR